jgi:AbrB family looped-hinge helix DNA binding protein
VPTSIVTRKGQVTIPAAIRRRLGLKRGRRVAFATEGNRAVLVPLEDDVAASFGVVKGRKTVSLEKMEAAIRSRFRR